MSNLSIKGIVAGDDFITETVLHALSHNENLSEYWISARNSQQCKEFKRKYNINATTDLDFVKEASVLILTFRFKDAKDMLTKLVGKIHKDTLLVSIIPSIKMKFIEDFFTQNELVRLTMNPSIISGEGLAAYIANDKASDTSKTLARNILSSFGKIVEVGDEDEFERVRKFIFSTTFLSYIIVKSMLDAAQKIGFSNEQSGVLVDQVLRGASRTLIKYPFEGGEMLANGLRNKKFSNTAIELIKEYGIYDSIGRYLTTKDAAALFNKSDGDEDDLSNFDLHYDWFEEAVSK